ncbi:hypothetical protein F544_13620 [Bibersteinia trehalosi USDA-ARS-USMARC-190]|uniref:Uncharacterized protein n=1 Tax=Bibersteinia trehalosi USDA-ARS-USMARC-190 TaxID=1263832 RepID=W0R8F0_BIBTR|nr:hypothetical protein F544_13620 [Bibersteinia trehalosi USDA-ARS-USMARC-190]
MKRLYTDALGGSLFRITSGLYSLIFYKRDRLHLSSLT